MSDEFPVFGADGKLMGNLTGNYGQAPAVNFNDVFSSFEGQTPLNPLPALPSTFAPSSTSPGVSIASSGGTTSGGSIASSGGNAASTLAAPASVASPSVGGGVVTGGLADYFLRAVIIILGFIFVAIGLNMFRPGIVPNPVRALRR